MQLENLKKMLDISSANSFIAKYKDSKPPDGFRDFFLYRFKPVEKVLQHVNGKELKESNAMIAIAGWKITEIMDTRDLVLDDTYRLSGNWELHSNGKHYFTPESLMAVKT